MERQSKGIGIGVIDDLGILCLHITQPDLGSFNVPKYEHHNIARIVT